MLTGKGSTDGCIAYNEKPSVNHLSAKSALNWPCSDVTFEIVVRNLCSLVLASGVETSARLVAKHEIRA